MPDTAATHASGPCAGQPVTPAQHPATLAELLTKLGTPDVPTAYEQAHQLGIRVWELAGDMEPDDPDALRGSLLERATALLAEGADDAFRREQWAAAYRDAATYLADDLLANDWARSLGGLLLDRADDIERGDLTPWADQPEPAGPDVCQQPVGGAHGWTACGRERPCPEHDQPESAPDGDVGGPYPGQGWVWLTPSTVAVPCLDCQRPVMVAIAEVGRRWRCSRCDPSGRVADAGPSPHIAVTDRPEPSGAAPAAAGPHPDTPDRAEGAELDLDAITDGATGWDRDWIAQLPGHLPSSTYLAPDLSGRAGRELAALLADVDALLAEVRQLRGDNSRLAATIAAVPDAHRAANLAHARMERDELRRLVSPSAGRVLDAARRVADYRTLGDAADWRGLAAAHRELRAAVDAVDGDQPDGPLADLPDSERAAFVALAEGREPAPEPDSGPGWDRAVIACPKCRAARAELAEVTASRYAWHGHALDLRAELATARRDAAADALETFARRDSNHWPYPEPLRWAADIRTGARTLPGSPQPAPAGGETTEEP